MKQGRFLVRHWETKYPRKTIPVAGVGKSTNGHIRYIKPRSFGRDENKVNVFVDTAKEGVKSPDTIHAPPPVIPPAQAIEDDTPPSERNADRPPGLPLKRPLQITAEELNKLDNKAKELVNPPPKRKKDNFYQFQPRD